MAKRFRGILERLLGSRQSKATALLASDAVLLQRFASSGDAEAFELLVWRHGAMILGLCRRQLRDEQLAEDAFQAVFLVLARKAGSIHGGNIAGWLYRVAQRVTQRTRSQLRPFYELTEAACEAPISSAERDELCGLLDREIARLPRRLREPVLLCYLAGRSTEEAAREIGCPRGTVLSRLSRARTLLAERLGRRGITLPTALVVAGIEFRGQLVSATVAASLKFLSRLQAINPVSTLANGVIQQMTRVKIFIALGVIVIANGLIGGVGWVAAQVASEPRAADQLLAQKQPASAANAPAQEKQSNKEKEILKLQYSYKIVDEELQELRRVLQQKVQQLQELTEEAERVNAKIMASIKSAETIYNIEREIVVEDVRVAAMNVRNSRRALEAAADAGITTQQLKERLSASEVRLMTTSNALSQLDETHAKQVANLLKGKLMYTHRAIQEQTLQVYLQEAARLTRASLDLKFRLNGDDFTPRANEHDQKLDQLANELRELRKEIAELKKGK